MYKEKLILAVVPARGGSKGIKLKNLRLIQGKPMVARVGYVVRRTGMIDRAVVSTDHAEIARVAATSGLTVPFMRPESLSGDQISDFDVLKHALLESERIDGVEYDIVMMLQPTSPLRRSEHLTGTVEMLVDEGWDAVWTVSPTDSKAHPLKQLLVDDETGQMDYYDLNGDRIIARQQLDTLYHRNGIAYAITRQCLLEQKTIKGARTGALVLEGNFVSIDTEWDIRLVEFILAQDGWSAT